jgi:hypothetical protein
MSHRILQQRINIKLREKLGKNASVARTRKVMKVVVQDLTEPMKMSKSVEFGVLI